MNAICCESVVADAVGGRWPGPLDLCVPTGAFCVVEAPSSLVGPLLRICAGLRQPVRGRVEVLGMEPALLDRRAARRFRGALGVGLRPGGLISNLTLRLNLTVPLLYSGAADPDGAGRRADEILETVGIAEWANFRPADVAEDVREQSGGSTRPDPRSRAASSRRPGGRARGTASGSFGSTLPKPRAHHRGDHAAAGAAFPTSGRPVLYLE